MRFVIVNCCWKTILNRIQYTNSTRVNHLRPTFITLEKNMSNESKCSASCSVDNSDVFYDTVLKIVKKAGLIVKEKTTIRNKDITTKSSDTDFVTDTDREVEKLLIDNLSKHFPDHKFIGEESVTPGKKCELTDSPTWIIDPIDGTMNFVHTFPHSSVSVGLFINKKPEIGIIYNAALGQLFTARKDKGAFLNGEPIKASEQTELSDTLLMLDLSTRKNFEKSTVVLQNLSILLPQIHGVRSLGACSLSMSMVACGAADAYIAFGIHIWDIAAGELIVREAGGVIIDPAGGTIDRFSRRMLAASSQKLAEMISQQIVQFYPLPRD